MIVRFKPLFPEDRDWFYKCATGPLVASYLHVDRLDFSLVSRDDFFAHWGDSYFSDQDPMTGRCYAIEADRRRIGFIAHMAIDKQESVTELVVGIKKAWINSHGYAIQSLSRFASFLYSTLGVRHCRIVISSANQWGLRMCRKAGFRVSETRDDDNRGMWMIFEKEFQLE